MYRSNGAPPFQPRGFSPEPPSQRSDMSRPSAKSIYMQRKEYSESINKQQDTFQYRAEHLFTWELDSRELSSIEDCVTKLKTLDSRGKVWGQEMILRVQARCLELCDIETKEVLESLPLGTILQTKAVLNSCMYDSLLVVTVQGSGRGASKAFLFQCEEAGVEEVRVDLEKAIQNRGEEGFHPGEMPFDIRSNLENIIGQGHHPGSFRRPVSLQIQSPPPPTEYSPPPFSAYQNYEDEMPRSPVFAPRDEDRYSPDMRAPRQLADPPPPPPYTDTERSVEIFNHVVGDINVFMNKVEAALKQGDGGKQKKNIKKYGENFPSIEEYVASLKKIKYGFNLLGKLNGHINNPGAPEYVHSLFSSLDFLVKQFPANVPPGVMSPMLIIPALDLLSHVVTPEEERLWSQLGDAWNVPRSKWPNAEEIPAYIPVFYDGWQLPNPVPPQTGPVHQGPSRSNSQRFPDPNSFQGPSRSNSQRFPEPNRFQGPSRSNGQRFPDPNSFQGPSYSNSQWFPDRSGMQQLPAQGNRPPGSQPTRSGQHLLRMRVIYDFTARNRQELSVMKGDVVQVVDKSRQWWIVRNSREEEGHVPPNVLEPIGGEEPARINRPPNLDMRSSPEEVMAWLQYKGFSKVTIRSLGMMNGAVLLGMRREDLRAVCPEEGGRVLFQLQAVKSALALATEVGHMQYGGH